MASSMLISFAPARARVYAATAKGTGGGAKEEKGFLDWVLGNLTKEDQFYETDPILQKVNDGKAKSSVALPQKTNGGFGGLFAKK